jgi:hypothetical protein
VLGTRSTPACSPSGSPAPPGPRRAFDAGLFAAWVAGAGRAEALAAAVAAGTRAVNQLGAGLTREPVNRT